MNLTNFSFFCFKRKPWGFPGGPVVKNRPANAGDVGSIPGLGAKISHTLENLSQFTTATEPQQKKLPQ